MARKNRKQETESFFSNISEETRNAVLGVASLVAGIVLLLAAFGVGGPVGAFINRWLHEYLFGIGYYILPLVFLMLATSLFRSVDRVFAGPQTFGAILFSLSSLGIVGTVSPIQGGVVGRAIGVPLQSLFGTALTLIILVALLVVSVLIIFDTSIKIDLLALLARIFKKSSPNVEGKAGLSEKEESALMRAEKNFVKGEEDEEEDGEDKEKPEKEPVIKKNFSKPTEEADGFAPLLIKRSGKVWNPPPLSLLERDKGKPGVGDIKANANIIKRTLQNFGIVVEMDEISIGPSVTRYALKPAEGVKLSKILTLQQNLELALAAHPVRIEAPIPGKSLVGIEVPNSAKTTIGLGTLLAEKTYAESDKPLLVALGKDVSGETHFGNIAKMPHALIAGATGSGKSVAIHTVINSLLYRNPPENLKFLMIDPKRVELTLYNKIPHLLTPVITDAKKAILALKWATKEMERRYDVLEKSAVRDIESYHKNVEGEEAEAMPYIVVIIDELADLMQAYPRELEAAIVRLAQMSRAVGIHLLLSTQRPSVNVITGLIKANVPSRIALQVASQIDSRTILDAAGAEKLLGAGDMLYLSGERSKPARLQSAFISEGEVKKVVKFLRDQYSDELTEEINFTNENTSNAIFSASLDDGEEEDELYEEAREIVMQAGKASTSFLQRKLRVGYARAARLIDILEEKGVIGPGEGAKPREVIGVSSSGGAEGFGESDDELN